MNSFSLNLKLQDSIKLVTSNSWLPVVVGLGYAAYSDPENIEHMLINAVPSVFLVLLIVSLIIWKTTYLKISSVGFAYPNWRGRDVNRKWSDNIEVTKSSNRCIIRDVSSKKNILIPTKVFDYPETQMNFKSNIPTGHVLLKLLP